MPQLVHDPVPLTEAVSYLDRVVAAPLVVVEPFDIVNVFVPRAIICRHRCRLHSAGGRGKPWTDGARRS